MSKDTCDTIPDYSRLLREKLAKLGFKKEPIPEPIDWEGREIDEVIPEVEREK